MDRAGDVTTFLNNVTPERRHRQAENRNQLFADVTGVASAPVAGGVFRGMAATTIPAPLATQAPIWPPGFPPRKARLSVYIMPGCTDRGHIPADPGNHKTGKSCLCINKLEDVGLAVLKTLVRAGPEDLATRWPIHPT